jgi:hypothetical protein
MAHTTALLSEPAQGQRHDAISVQESELETFCRKRVVHPKTS